MQYATLMRFVIVKLFIRLPIISTILLSKLQSTSNRNLLLYLLMRGHGAIATSDMFAVRANVIRDWFRSHIGLPKDAISLTYTHFRASKRARSSSFIPMRLCGRLTLKARGYREGCNPTPPRVPMRSPVFAET
ncbi:uncharacterized protein FFB20_00457 [Fusarium fujikuroi]|uniref:Uncharacterized protein n=1 Tax=Fusarium fujikuroi TaxID=5127 RepID=A0A2H3SB24_FUSFU|nr:uncharacterized protein FFB20_00457 [Fusarium fujikuroi]SCN73364.1 uncharacterized protein FFE2_02829 [Fusarium fujikuroi]SCN88549.1 uncharacterized protein FFM5_04444 [Fusarium fujikuroi]SCO04670.1 uncharacterized protein FFC1_09708 [Fusarium fujikuroi]SCO35996.1 uncharacterized protein FFNC_04980 [Fusarium fujikuroi]